MIERLKALKKLDRKRLDATLMRIHGRPSLMVFFNLILLGINSLGKIKATAKILLSKAGLVKTGSLTGTSHLQSLPSEFTDRVFSQNLSVLIVCETSIDQCFRYRVKQKLEQLNLLGIRNHWLDWTNYMEVTNQINFYDVIIFYRVPGYPKMLANIDYANRLGKIVIYDTDDLIFDRSTLESYYGQNTGQLSAKDRKAVFKGADLYRMAIERCGFALTTTETLQTSLETVVGEENVSILPNGLDSFTLKAVTTIHPVKPKDGINLFYGSGTKTHDQDFALIASALEKILSSHQQVNLVIVGYLTLPEQLGKFADRITKLDLLEINEYFDLLVHTDVNLAPLASGLFADCKSEIKWLEAAAFAVPTVASATKVYQDVITHNVDGMLANSTDEWFVSLDRLISDGHLRHTIGQAAAIAANENYSATKNADRLFDSLKRFKQIHIKNSHYLELRENRRCIVIVNVLYPPQAMGGATVVAQNIVESLSADYADRYHVCVFTCDVNNIYAHQVTEYEHNGISVTAVSVPVGPDVDYREYDPQVGELFAEFIDYKQPDLIHFHSIQRLTASMLEAADNAGVPFVTTVHDAWWLSDHQFLVDKKGESVNELQVNPIVAAQTSNQLQRTLERRKLLVSWLNKSEKVLAVSEYQRRFYRKNAINNVVVNKNGVNRIEVPPRSLDETEKVVLGYTGSVCHHKGYYFLKEVVESIDLKNINIKVIQFDLTEAKTEVWKDTEVEFLPKFDSSRMVEFYGQIDVLVAPSMWPESFGLITREAALAGIWVVASDAGGLAEIIEDGKNGFKFEIGNAAQLISILKEIDSSPDHYRQRVDKNKLKQLTVTSIAEQIDQLVNIYDEILTEKTLH